MLLVMRVFQPHNLKRKSAGYCLQVVFILKILGSYPAKGSLCPSSLCLARQPITGHSLMSPMRPMIGTREPLIPGL